MTRSDDEVRAAIDRLLHEQGIDYARVSALIGRNPAYIQQYIKRGTPRRLAEQDRARIAAFLGVDEGELGGPPRAAPALPPVAAARRGARMGVREAALASPAASLQLVPRLAVGASAGAGASVDGEPVEGAVAFDTRWLRDLGADPRALSLIRVAGDSMAPTLNDGDDILVDGQDAAQRLRDGIYVLRLDDVLMVKRVGRGPAGRIAVTSDNPHYQSYPDLPLSAVRLVGRVVWTGRRVR